MTGVAMDDIGKRAAGQLGDYATAGRSEERSMGDIMRDIMAHAQEIIRSEIKLARVETKEEAKKLMQAGVVGAAGGVLALLGLLFLCLTGMFALAIVMPMWGAALCMMALLFIAGGALLAAGRQRFKTVNMPERTIGEMKENVQWLKHPTRS
jgi:uncharacterized membrane protein YqjE